MGPLRERAGMGCEGAWMGCEAAGMGGGKGHRAAHEALAHPAALHRTIARIPRVTHCHTRGATPRHEGTDPPRRENV